MKLTEKYLYAVKNRLPEGQRVDIEREIRSLIEDMIEEKGGYSLETEKAVLKELGNPRVLANKYLDREDYLIGPQFYDKFLFVLKLAVIVSLFGVLVASIVDAVSNGVANPYAFAGTLLGELLSAVVGAVGAVTLLFVALERQLERQVNKDFFDKMNREWDPEDLPDIPQDQAEFSKTGIIVGLVFSFIFVMLINYFPHLSDITININGVKVSAPLFNMDVYLTYLPYLNLVLAVQIIVQVYKLIYGYWSWAAAIFNLAANILVVVVIFMLMGSTNLINQDAIALALQNIPADAARSITQIPGGVKIALWIIIPAITIFDSAKAFYYANKSRKVF